MVILYNKLLELFKVGMQMNDKIKENLLDQSCAPTDNLQSNWDRIDWTKAEQAVKKLQARIVKAQKEGRHNKVKALQWTLTHSFYAKALAVKRVTSNGGGCTPGVDKEIWDTPKAKNASNNPTQTQRLPANAAEKSSYQEEQRQTATVGNTDNERQSYASTLSYGIGACIRNYS